MRLRADYQFDLPAEQIAQVPADRRDASRLLVVGDGAPADRRFADIVELLPADAVLVVNDTRVLPARLRAHKDSGGAVELLFLEPVSDGSRWRCMARASKPIRAGARLHAGDATLTVCDGRAEDGTVTVEADRPIVALLRDLGEVPLPPYIRRDAGVTAADLDRYQTVYAERDGAVAAPTAGLHFTAELLASLSDRGVAIAPLTLHVGPGTFAPMRAAHIDDHVLHEERFDIPEATARLVASGRPVVAVGTTSVRALESAATGPRQLRSGPGRTRLFITPGYDFQIVDHLVTNFHLPESTLLMLVAAFAGYDRVLGAYRHAVASGYRFYSYGDAMLLSPEAP